MGSGVIDFDSDFDRLLSVGKWLYRGIERKTREFYAAYVRKCNEYNCYMDFFEVLYAYLVGCGFRRRKIDKYLGMVHGNICKRLESAVSGGKGASDDGKGG